MKNAENIFENTKNQNAIKETDTNMKKFLAIILCTAMCFVLTRSSGADHIKWIDFTPTKAAMSDALECCIKLHDEGKACSFSELLAYVSAGIGGDFRAYKKEQMTAAADIVKNGGSLSDSAKNQKLFSYYAEAYEAVLGGMVGEYTEQTYDGGREKKYGLRAYSPIAEGYYYNHYDDFGASRSFGYKRNHLGHDLMGSVGTPVVAVEGGYVEACGWNMYGGWRIGIRSFDGKRYYYYAHLRKGHPYTDMYEGRQVAAGEVIGYLGMTGYSSKPDTNNINVPHLHYGLEVIFTPEQKDGWNQIWIDMYAITDFLEKNKAPVTTIDGEAVSQRISIADIDPD